MFSLLLVYTTPIRYNNKITWNNKPFIKETTLLINQNAEITWNKKTKLIMKTVFLFGL